MPFGVFPVAPCRRTCPRCTEPVPVAQCHIPVSNWGRAGGPCPRIRPSPGQLWSHPHTTGVPVVNQHGCSPGGFRGVLQPAHRRLHIAASSGAALQAPGIVAVSGTCVPFKINSTKDAGAGWFACVADCHPADTAPPAPVVLPRHKATLPSA